MPLSSVLSDIQHDLPVQSWRGRSWPSRGSGKHPQGRCPGVPGSKAEINTCLRGGPCLRSLLGGDTDPRETPGESGLHLPLRAGPVGMSLPGQGLGFHGNPCSEPPLFSNSHFGTVLGSSGHPSHTPALLHTVAICKLHALSSSMYVCVSTYVCIDTGIRTHVAHMCIYIQYSKRHYSVGKY